MKRIISVLLIMVLVVGCMTGCVEKRKLFNSTDFSKYIEPAEYKGIKVDSTTDEFKEEYDKYYFQIIMQYDSLFVESDKTVVELTDKINFDYEGKIDGVAFEGGTAKAADLIIGSGQFISGFEDSLVGAKLGEILDINVTFPENYGKDELNGKAAVFTCKINSIKEVADKETVAKKLGFDSAKDLEDSLVKELVINEIYADVCENFKVKNYPDGEVDKIVDITFDHEVLTYKENHNVDFEEYLVARGYTIDKFKAEMKADKNFLESNVKSLMIMYYIFDTENLELLESTLNSQNTDDEATAEMFAVQETVLNYLYDNAEIK